MDDEVHLAPLAEGPFNKDTGYLRHDRDKDSLEKSSTKQHGDSHPFTGTESPRPSAPFTLHVLCRLV